MGYKAVISDLDGTLLNSKHMLSDYTKEVVKKIVDKGIHFIIATGRHHMDVDSIRKSLGLDTVMITSNGSRVHDADNNEILKFNIEAEIVKEMLEIECADHIHRNIYQGDKWLIEKEYDIFKDFHNESGFYYTVENFSKLASYEASKLFFLSENIEDLEVLKAKLEDKFGDDLSIAYSLPQCLEVMPKGVSKGYAIEKIMESYNLELKDVVAFGDGFNDFEMLSIVGKGLVMGNANDKLKASLPKNEVIKSNHEDGVGTYLEELFLK